MEVYYYDEPTFWWRLLPPIECIKDSREPELLDWFIPMFCFLSSLIAYEEVWFTLAPDELVCWF